MNGSGGDYVSAFNSLLRTAREEFKLMLCDLDKCEPEQVALLRPCCWRRRATHLRRTGKIYWLHI